MDIHILDFVVWFLGLFVVWYAIDKIWDGEYTNDLGGLFGMFIIFIYTIIYIIIFGVFDCNISDINIDIPNIGVKL